MTPKASVNSSAISQPVATPLTRAAIFLVVTVNPGADNRVVIRHLCKDLSSLVRSAGFRELEGSLSCVMAVGSETWDRLFGQPRPAELRKFREIHAGEPRSFDTGRSTLPHPSAATGPVLRAGDTDHGSAGKLGLPRGRGPRIPLL